MVNYANSLYSSSKMTLPLAATEDIARYHLCCYVVIENFQSLYNLPDPFQTKIPLPGRRLNTLLGTFRSLFAVMLESTPRANRIVDTLQLQTPQTTPQVAYAKSTPSHIDEVINRKIQSIDSTRRSLKDQLTSLGSPPATPKKTPRAQKALQTSPAKLAPYRSRTKVVITTPLLISFCNKFYIPEHITLHILQTYKLYRNIVTNSWGLLVGLVGISYLKLNKDEIHRKIGLKNSLFDTLHRSQQGGLSLQEVKTFIREVTRMVAKQKWIKEAKFEDSETQLDTVDIDGFLNPDDPLNPLSSFLDFSVAYITLKDSPNVEKWVKKIKRSASRVDHL